MYTRVGVLSKHGIRICYPESVYLCHIHSDKKHKDCKRRGRLPGARLNFLFRNRSTCTALRITHSGVKYVESNKSLRREC